MPTAGLFSTEIIINLLNSVLFYHWLSFPISLNQLYRWCKRFNLYYILTHFFLFHRSRIWNTIQWIRIDRRKLERKMSRLFHFFGKQTPTVFWKFYKWVVFLTWWMQSYIWKVILNSILSKTFRWEKL